MARLGMTRAEWLGRSAPACLPMMMLLFWQAGYWIRTVRKRLVSARWTAEWTVDPPGWTLFNHNATADRARVWSRFAPVVAHVGTIPKLRPTRRATGSLERSAHSLAVAGRKLDRVLLAIEVFMDLPDFEQVTRELVRWRLLEIANQGDQNRRAGVDSSLGVARGVSRLIAR